MPVVVPAPSRICLVIPPSVFLLDERVFMTLGILRLAAVLEQQGTIVEMVDLSGIANYGDAIADHARTSPSMIFGITATTPQLPSTIETANRIRRERPEVKLILGGPHVTLVNAAFKREEKLQLPGRATTALERLKGVFDVLVAGDGEDAILMACAPQAPQLIDADDPKSPLFLTNSRLESLPFPARHLVDVDSYHYSIDGEPALSLIAQLGCPFECGFCGGRESPMLRKIRTRSPSSVVDEMVHIYKTHGHSGFMLYDDELNVNRSMLELMARIEAAQHKLGAQWRLRGFIKAELFTDQQAAAMYQAGFRWILTGFESGSPKILQNINKKATQDENSQCAAIARRHGLKVKALMSIGHPGESVTTIQETTDWLLQARPDEFDVTIITCYPGTPYYDHALPAAQPGVWTYTCPKSSDRLHQVEVDYTTTADYYKGDPNGGYRAYVFTDEMSSEALVAERDRMERVVRGALGIQFNLRGSNVHYEHSMGQHGFLPAHIV